MVGVVSRGAGPEIQDMMDYLGTVQRIEQMFDSACQRSRIGGEVHCDIRSKGTPPLHTGSLPGPRTEPMLARFSRAGDFMTTPLDPVIAQIIPLLPLRDPATMTPQSARDQLRALAASRAAVPPPPVAGIEETQVKGAAGPLAARVYRVSNE